MKGWIDGQRERKKEVRREGRREGRKKEGKKEGGKEGRKKCMKAERKAILTLPLIESAGRIRLFKKMNLVSTIQLLLSFFVLPFFSLKYAPTRGCLALVN